MMQSPFFGQPQQQSVLNGQQPLQSPALSALLQYAQNNQQQLNQDSQPQAPQQAQGQVMQPQQQQGGGGFLGSIFKMFL